MSFLLRRPLPSLPTKTSPISSTSNRTFTTTPPRPVAKMTIVGRLAADPEEIPTSNATPMIRYALGTTQGPKDKRQTSWWKVACFPQSQGLRDLMLGLGKGSLVYVEGDAAMRKYKNAEDQEQQALSIIQRQIDILEKRDPGQGESSRQEREESP